MSDEFTVQVIVVGGNPVVQVDAQGAPTVLVIDPIGTPGAPGKDGLDGADGADGNDGAQGPQGPQGIQGDPPPPHDPADCENPWVEIFGLAAPVGNDFTSPVLDNDNLLIIAEGLTSDGSFTVELSYAVASDPGTFLPMGEVQSVAIDAAAEFNSAILITGMLLGRLWAQASKTAPTNAGIAANAFGPSRGGSLSVGEQVVRLRLSVVGGAASGAVRFLSPCGLPNSLIFTTGVLDVTEPADKFVFVESTELIQAQKFIAGGWTLMMKSDDGLVWTDITETWPNAQGFYGAATNRVGDIVFASFDQYIVTSHDNGATWNLSVVSNMSQPCRAAAYGAGIFIVTGAVNTAVYSLDLGDTWTPSADPGFGVSGIFGAAFGLGSFVVAGEAGKIATSPDGNIWTQRTSGRVSDYGAVAFGNGVFVAVGQEGSLSVDGGVTWSDIPVTGSAAAYAPEIGTWVVVTSTHAWVSTDDGANWTLYLNTVNRGQQAVAWVGSLGLFASVGLEGYIWASPDGITWTQQDHSHVTEYDTMLAV